MRIFFPSPFSRAGMEKKKEESPPRVPFGHPGLAIRHPLRGLGVQVIDSKSVLPVANFSTTILGHYTGNTRKEMMIYFNLLIIRML